MFATQRHILKALLEEELKKRNECKRMLEMIQTNQLVCNFLVDLKKLDSGGLYRQRICIP